MVDEKNANIIDLDDFIPDEKTVIIRKREYKVNGSASVKTTLALMKNAMKWEKSPTTPESIDALISSVQAFFITPIEKEILLDLDVAGQLPKLMAFLYGQKLPVETEKKADGQPEKK